MFAKEAACAVLWIGDDGYKVATPSESVRRSEDFVWAELNTE